MANKTEIVTLRAFRPFLTILTIFESNNFYTTNQRMFIRNLSRAFGVTLVFSGYVCLFLSGGILACIQHNFDLNVVAQPLSFFISGIQVPYYYGILFWKSDKIIGTLEYLHRIVEKRERV